MVVVYHSTYGDANRPVGGRYRGSQRELLSEFLGGPVGFAFPRLEMFGEGGTIVRILLDDDCPVVLSLGGEDVPRRDGSGRCSCTFLGVLSGETCDHCRQNWDYGPGCRYVYGKASEVEKLFGQAQGELVFLAAKARFGAYVRRSE